MSENINIVAVCDGESTWYADEAVLMQALSDLRWETRRRRVYQPSYTPYGGSEVEAEEYAELCDAVPALGIGYDPEAQYTACLEWEPAEGCWVWTLRNG
jgi:hypothetical protein